MSNQPPIQAAGAVVWRAGDPGVQVVLVHRPGYVDWTFPKGTVDPGEQPPSTAVREVAEETGLRVRLGPPVAVTGYRVGDRRKQVHYWSARPAGGDLSSFRPNTEVDEVVWLPLPDARDRLTHTGDAEVLDAFAEAPFDADPLLVVRHAHAHPRDSWHRDDRLRPLTEPGRRQASALAPLLRGYAVQRVLTSDATRCATTVEPFARQARIEPECGPVWSEVGATPDGVAGTLQDLLSERTRLAVCTHQKVLPMVLAALDLDGPRLDPGGLLVVHHRAGRVRATEHHPV